jgi:hypothetical protein
MAVPRFTIWSVMIAVVISSFYMLAVREVGWPFTSFCTVMVVTPAIGISMWQKLGIEGFVVGSLTSAWWCVVYFSVTPGVIAPFVTLLAAMLLWSFTQSVQPGTRVQTLISQAMWGTISFFASLCLSAICLFIWGLTFA